MTKLYIYLAHVLFIKFLQVKNLSIHEVKISLGEDLSGEAPK